MKKLLIVNLGYKTYRILLFQKNVFLHGCYDHTQTQHNPVMSPVHVGISVLKSSPYLLPEVYYPVFLYHSLMLKAVGLYFQYMRLSL